MRITLLAVGSRGDVQPYLALGAGLRVAGHAVRLATHAIFAPLVEPYGVELYPLGGDPREMMDNELGHVMLAAGKNPLRFVKTFAGLLEPVIRQMLEMGLQACADADAVIFSGLGMISGIDLAERLGKKACYAFLQPMLPTRAFPSAFFPDLPRWLPARGVYHYGSHLAFQGLLEACFAPIIRRARKELGLPPLPSVWRASPRPLLFGYSPQVIPPPPDWSAAAHVTGYWFLDSPRDWQPPAGLCDFLAAGPPPVYIGFGSMISRQPEAVAALAVEALARAGQRGVLHAGWGGLRSERLPESVYLIEAVPHDWLFPRMAAVVHHGGAGTTSAGLRAGVPSVVVPFFADQPFWARRVHQLGVGPAPIPRAHLTVDRLAQAITAAVADPALAARAAALGARIRQEDGVRQAVEIFGHYCRDGGNLPSPR